VVCPECDEVFWCRHCHNAVKNGGDTPPDQQHELDRFRLREVVCMRCSERQPAGPSCVKCKQPFSSYYCDKCHLWDDGAHQKQTFHCDRCGICRVGGRENFFHCDTCGSCYPVSIRDTHKCIERAMHQDCPVCLENLFNSTRVVTILRNCGHTIHQECLTRLTSDFSGLSSLRCPLCSASIMSNDSLWQQLDEQVRNTPMQDEYRADVMITCNDCSRPSTTPFHFFGLKCQNPSCGSYNTRRVV